MPLSECIKIDANYTIKSTLKLFENKNIRYFIVCDEGKILGVISENELIRAYLQGKSLMDTVSTIASSENTCIVDLNYNLDEIASILKGKAGVYIVVKEKNDVLGVVTKELLELHKTKLMYNELDRAFEHSPNSIVILDGEGKTLRVNKAYEHITGINREEALGVDVKLMEAKGMYNPAAGRLVLQEKRKVSVIQKIKNQKEALVTAVPLYDDEGNIFRIIMNSIDLKELSIINKFHSNQKKGNYIKEAKEVKIVHDSQCMKSIINLSNQLKDIDSTVLITGESGVGKGVIARYIHNNGVRKKGRLVEINCGAIPDTLLESELLGYESGAFTGAHKNGKQGLIELAHNGTLFLDEIGEMSMQLQVKLLQVIQERQIIRVGGTTPIDVDVRIIAATNKNLREMVDQGNFRLDLFYRLNVVPINIPPLVERQEDLVPMVKYFLDKYNKRYNKEVIIGDSLLKMMLEYDWPGNVRELENVIECLVVINPSGVIERNNDKSNFTEMSLLTYKEKPTSLGEITSLEEAKKEFERKIFENAYKKHKSSYKVAEVLKISQATANRKIREYIQE